jgi:hypothetical protein
MLNCAHPKAEGVKKLPCIYFPDQKPKQYKDASLQNQLAEISGISDC